jgi:hypothetical protein
MGVSRSLFRRRVKARQQAAREVMFDRLQWQVAELKAHLNRCAAFHAAMAREFDCQIRRPF